MKRNEKNNEFFFSNACSFLLLQFNCFTSQSTNKKKMMVRIVDLWFQLVNWVVARRRSQTKRVLLRRQLILELAHARR